VWCYKSGGASQRHFANKHDIIFFYAKAQNYVFNVQKDKSYISGKFGFKATQHLLDKDEKGWFTTVNQRDVWEINMVGRSSHERTGYPTQKPLALLERIIKASSNEDDVVLDPFCGCATTCVAAEKLKRRWIGIDKSKIAYYMVYWRAHNEGIGTQAQPDLFGRNISLIDNPKNFPTRTDKKDEPLFYEVKSRAELKRTRTSMDERYKKEAKDILYEEQTGLCNGCDQYMRKVDLTIDHIVPQSHESNHDIDNLQLLCYRCNNW